ncbi:MAG: F420-0:Gamma-glutamyl ligase, partial [Leptolyngbyaceae cyanobacterium T60_A2020_046]|nr:F420-0:Gamma-glutamyl ligase [Leptolyngbyaceae cyanobacterium T60_A2020_046]
VAEIQRATGLEAAIVDVNDLGAVKILASTPGINAQQLTQALIDNPAGNADEQTPLVLVRPQSASAGEPGSVPESGQSPQEG